MLSKAMTMNSAVVAECILLALIVALVFAAFYALFGHPSSSKGRKRKQEVRNGFRLAAGILLGFVLMGTLVGCAGIAFGSVNSTRMSRPVAGVIAVSALILIGLMVQWWAKYFAGWIIWGVVNSLIMASSGHLLNNPAIPVSRPLALTMAGLCAVTVFACLRFTKSYKLHTADKLALMTWILAFTWAANAQRFGIAALSVGSLVLMLAWWLDRNKTHRPSDAVVQRHELESQRF